MAKEMRAALYLRVSTDEQTVENQCGRLKALAAARGWPLVAVYADEGISGAKGREGRPQVGLMLKDARRRRFDLLLVWSIDRLGRSTAAVTTIMAELGQLGVGIYADKEGMDSTTGHGRAMLQMAAVFGELERSMTVERIKAGIARVRAKGGRTGRAPVSPKVEAAIRAELSTGKGMLKVAKALQVSSGTVQRVAHGLSPAAATQRAKQRRELRREQATATA